MRGGVIAASSLQAPHPEVPTTMHHQKASEGSGFEPFRRGFMEKLNPEIDFTITFDPDIDEFIASIVRDNKMYSSNTLDYLKKYEI